MQDYITKEKKKELEAEHQRLSTVRRKEILEALEYAKSLGDLSENAEYHEARNEQRKLQQRLEEIEYVLKNAMVVERHGSSVVEVGATVVVEKLSDGSKKTFMLVGGEEADTAAGKISHMSPLGAALFGAKAGDTVTFDSPGGEVQYKIISIS